MEVDTNLNYLIQNYLERKKLVKDGQIWKEVEEDYSFSVTFEISSHSCTVIQHGEKYELRIDNQSFNHLLDLERNKNYFQKDSQPTSSSYVFTKPLKGDNKYQFEIVKPNNEHKEDKQNMFNFAIKEKGEVHNNVTAKKFGEKLNQTTNSNVHNSTKNQNEPNLLIDFNSDNQKNSSSKSN